MTSAAPHQAIYRRWRAQTFSQIVGQEAVVGTLRNAVRSGRVSHAILFVGPRGTGKTSLARIVAKALNCTDLRDGDPCDQCPSCVAIREGTTLDVVEIDAASNRGINEVRDLRDRLQYAPVSLRRKVYILDEAHQITRDAWNALLKSLEEPPDFVVFIFASTHPHDFPPAILSRLQRYDVRRLTPAEIEGKLARILEADGRVAQPGALRLIARLAAGGMRDAESMLDQLLSSVDGTLDEMRVRDLLGLAEAEAIERFVAALVAGDAAAGIALLDELEDRGRDARTFLDQVVEAVRSGLVAGLADRSGPDARQAGLIAAARRLSAIDPGRAGAGGLRLQLELALFDAASPTAPPTATSRVDTVVVASSGREASLQIAAGTGGSEPSPSPVPSSPRTRTDPGVTSEPRPSAASRGMGPPPTPAIPPSGSSRSVPGGLALPATTPASAPTPVPVSAASASGSAGRPGSSNDAEPGASADNPDLARLRELWPRIVAHISTHPPTRPLIIACRPIAVEGHVVTLGFPEDQAFLQEVAIRRRPNLEAGIAEFLGHAVNVRCVATNLDRAALPGSDADAAFLLAEARRIFADDIVDIGEVR